MPDTTASPSPEDALRSAYPFGDVLCAVDGTRRSFAAVEQAARLAGPDGRLTLLAVTAERGSGVYSSAVISPQRAERFLESAKRIAERAGVRCEAVLDPTGPPPAVILARADEHDLLALGAPWASWLGAMLFDGVAEAALESFSTPMLAARIVAGGHERFGQRILVASDGLDGSDELVELAGRLAQGWDGRVTLAHVTGVESRARPHRIEAQGEQLHAALGERAEVRVEVGPADEAIMRVASEASCSLVLMSSHRLGGLASTLGSVSRRVVHKAHCSVLLVPPELLQS